MDQHRHAEALEQQGKQGRQVGFLARPVVGRQDDRPAAPMRHLELMGALVGRRQETEHFVE